MAPVNCLKFVYLGMTRYLFCDLNQSYEEIQKLVAKTFSMAEECITAIQFTDGKGYIFNKDLFEYFILLFPQPEQKFYVRLEFSKILSNRIAFMEGKQAPFSFVINGNKRKLRDLQETEEDDNDNGIIAAPVRRMNCFLGSLPDTHTSHESEVIEDSQPQPKKRRRLMKSMRKSTGKIVKQPQVKRTLRI